MVNETVVCSREDSSGIRVCDRSGEHRERRRVEVPEGLFHLSLHSCYSAIVQ